MQRSTLFFLIFSSLLVACLSVPSASAQVGFGMHFANDVYQSVSNPDDSPQFSTAKSIVISPSFGPKVYFGLGEWSASLQTAVGISPFSWDWEETKGLGTLYAPSLFSLNYGGLNGFSGPEAKLGISAGLGMQLALTDLYFRKGDFRDEGINLLATPFAQAAIGYGTKGTAAYLYLRYGSDSDGSEFFAVGVALDINFIQRRDFR